jgi:hypothetical protein
LIVGAGVLETLLKIAALISAGAMPLAYFAWGRLKSPT